MTRDPEALGADRRESGVAVGVAFLLTLAFFWPTLASFPGTWARWGMSHGWFVAGLVAWLPWRDRARLLRGGEGLRLAFFPLAVFSLLWFTSTVAQIQIFHQTVLVLLLASWGMAVFGRDGVRTAVGAAATFFLALPFWDILVPVLRVMATVVSGNLVRLLGIPAEIEGDIVRIASGTFLVADSCAGLRFLLAGLAVGAFYAHVLVRRWPVQLAVMGLAVVISVMGNWVRISTLIVIGHVTEMQSGLIRSHLGFGWVIFTLGLVPFFFLAQLIEKRGEKKAAGAETKPGPEESDGEVATQLQSEEPEVGGETRGDLEEEDGEAGGGPESAAGGTEAQTPQRREGPGRLARRAAAATAVAVVGPVLYFVFGALPAANVGEGGLEEVARGEEWRVAEMSPERPFGWRPAYQGADQHDSLAFTDGERMVYGDRFVYRQQAQGAKLIGYPNRIAPGADIFEERLMGPVDPARRLWVQQAVVLTPEGPVLVWYWYRVGGVDTFSPVHAKILEIPAFLSRRRASELIALSAACEADNCRDAFQALAGFMGVRSLDASGGEPVEASDTTEAADTTGGPQP